MLQVVQARLFIQGIFSAWDQEALADGCGRTSKATEWVDLLRVVVAEEVVNLSISQLAVDSDSGRQVRKGQPVVVDVNG